MKKKSDLRMHLNPAMKKLFMELKIALLIIVLGISNALASAGSLSYIDKSVELQPIQVSGTVTDEAGSSLPGVNIMIEGTLIGVISDVNGKYTLAVPDKNGVLVFTFVGYLSQKIPAQGRTTIDVQMLPDIMNLDEVVVIGYGTMKKSDLTGSVVRVNMEDKASLANVNVSQALSGTSAGVNVQGSGLAGSEPDLSIRGKTSLSATDRPLIILDGIIYNGSISDINISDVESIDILKDASAAAVYGSRSANGVMLITTKKGTSVKPVIAFNMYYGYQDMTNNPMRVMNGDEFAIRLVDYYYQQDLYKWYATKPSSDMGKPVRPDIQDRNIVAARLKSVEERNNYLAGNEINWVDQVTRIAPIQNYNLSISEKVGGSNYFVSTSYTDEEGILLNDQFTRFTVLGNVESKLRDWLSVGFASRFSHLDYSGLNASLSDARNATPFADNKIGSPNYDVYMAGELYNRYPLTDLYVDNEDIQNTLFLKGNAIIRFPWIEGLSYEINYANTSVSEENNAFYPVKHNLGMTNRGRANKNPSTEKSWIVNNIITYLRTFNDHQLNATLLYSEESRNASSSSIRAEGFDNPVLGFRNVSFGTIVQVGSSAWEEKGISYMARANYSYRNRYMLTGTIRRDGYSGFGANHKFATFPSASLGWVITEESFLNNFDWLYLKLRTSYGINGNQGLGRYKSFSTMQSDAYVFGPNTTIAVYPNTLGNQDLKWEKTSSFNMGFDFNLMKGKVSGAIDLYNATTSDVLVQRALPRSSGYSSVWTNLAGIENKGIELELSSVNMDRKIRWESGFVFSLNRDKISKLYGGEEDMDIGNSWFIGESISAIYDYEMVGTVWTEEELYSGNILTGWYPGQFKFIDQNGDGLIRPGDDRKIVGNKSPSFRFSINNAVSYKNLTLRLLINSIQGGNRYYLEDNTYVLNIHPNSDNVHRQNLSAVRPYWTPDNGVTNATGIYHAPAVHGGIYQSRSFVRLQDISLTYRLSPALLKTIRIESGQAFVTAKNLFTWTKWSGWDPETGTSNNPLMRNITAGIRFSL